MARKFQFKRGNKAQMPVLAVGEPAFATDEGKLYLGDGTCNISIARGDHTHTAEQVGALSSRAGAVDAAGNLSLTGTLKIGALTLRWDPVANALMFEG